MEEEKTNEQQDSIKLTKNSKGYNWELKRYYNYDRVKTSVVIEQLQEIDQQLKAKFGNQDG